MKAWHVQQGFCAAWPDRLLTAFESTAGDAIAKQVVAELASARPMETLGHVLRPQYAGLSPKFSTIVSCALAAKLSISRLEKEMIFLQRCMCRIVFTCAEMQLLMNYCACCRSGCCAADAA
jgi:hypothetical protein